MNETGPAATVAASHPAYAADRGGAFSLDVQGSEEVVVVHEVSRHHLRHLDPTAVVVAAVEAVGTREIK